MTLLQFHSLKTWHQRHWREHPVEKHTWDAVLTVWCAACVGALVSLVLFEPLGELACLALMFLPSAYVNLRAHLHRTGRLRCDWVILLR